MFSLKDKVGWSRAASQGMAGTPAQALVVAGAKLAVGRSHGIKLALLVGEITAAGGKP